MGEFSLGQFFEALFKYGKDYGFTLWHFMGLAVLGIILWIGSKVAAGAGKAVQGAQNVYIKMIEDLQKKADADRADQEARVESLRQQLLQARGDLAAQTAELDAANQKLLEASREAARLRQQLAMTTNNQPHEGGPHAAPQLPPAAAT